MANESKPFEIRTSLLHLAKNILSENAHLELAKNSNSNKQLEYKTVYTTENVIKEAEKLYAFVSKRS